MLLLILSLFLSLLFFLLFVFPELDDVEDIKLVPWRVQNGTKNVLSVVLRMLPQLFFKIFFTCVHACSCAEGERVGPNRNCSNEQ